MALRGPGRPELAPGEARTVKLTVYVREVDERFLDLVAGSDSKRISGWAYRALLEAAVAEARKKGLKIPVAVAEQLRRVQAETRRGSDPRGKRRPRAE
jgi:hypothetical protein